MFPSGGGDGGGGRKSKAVSGAAADVLARRLRGALPGRGYQRMDYNAIRSQIRDNKQYGSKAAAKIHGIKVCVCVVA